MSRNKTIKVIAFIIVILSVIAFCIFMNYYIGSSVELTSDERARFAENFSPIRIILFGAMGLSVSQIIDSLLKRRVFFGNELLSRPIRFIASIVGVILCLVLMLTNVVLFYAIPVLALILLVMKRFFK